MAKQDCFLLVVHTIENIVGTSALYLKFGRTLLFRFYAIVESEDVKKKLFVNLDKIAKSTAILASNTSSISITRLASATTRPQQVMLILFL
ncbi:hypothetical protein SLE2022_393610 [Rubroshorea leprosula]